MDTFINILRKTSLYFLTKDCYEEYFTKYNFFHGPCFSATLSKALGIALIIGSILVKLPQIIKIVKNKSGEGISIFAVSLELTAITIYAAYSFVKQFPFSAWGDAAFLAVQTVAIAFLVLFYGGRSLKGICYLTFYVVVCAVIGMKLIPVNVLWTLQGINIPILVSAKLAQAHANYKNGHTGQLSAITVFMLFFGSVARIFTSIQETGDFMVILTYVFSTMSNAVIAIQMLYYWNAVAAKKKD